ncbi:MAG TPA: dockerin type I domain-containing protein, partial [Lacipirellulaceae bacterium]|nr:dockerin type I domain-containing protein [Lacipirellulaceae bacterium]
GFSPATVYRGSVDYNGTLEIEVGGTTPGSFDRIIHSGVATLGGTLDVSLLDGFTPTAGDAFQILTAAGGVSGAFATELLPALGGGLFLDVLYSANAVSLSVAGVAGDYNRNGTVDAADYVLWRKTLGQMGVGLTADGNDNGSIDASDYDVWRANFGRTAGAASGSSVGAAAPEPMSCVLLLTAALAAICCRRAAIY